MEKTNQPEPHADPAPDLRQELASHAQKLAALSTELDTQRNQLRDYEKALVERIADVDDDRRSTATKLQRAWRTQGEELDDRLRRQAMYAAGSLILLAVILLGAMFLLYQQTVMVRQSVDEDLAEIRSEIGEAPGIGAIEQLVDGKLAGLSAKVDGVSASLEELIEDREDASRSDEARDSGPPDVIQDLKSEQQALARQLESLTDLANEREERVREPLDQERASREEAVTRLTGEIGRLQGAQRRLVDDIRSLRETLDGRVAASVAATGRAQDQGAGSRETGAPAGGQTQDTQAGAGSGTDPAARAPKTESPGADLPGATRTAAAGEADSATAPQESTAAKDRVYALQLIGVYSIDSLRRFAARGDLGETGGYLEERFNGRPWFVVIHSVHPDYSSAKSALSGLPSDLRDLGPWIRPLSPDTGIQALETGSDGD